MDTSGSRAIQYSIMHMHSSCFQWKNGVPLFQAVGEGAQQQAKTPTAFDNRVVTGLLHAWSNVFLSLFKVIVKGTLSDSG